MFINPYRYAVISSGFPSLSGLWARYRAEDQPEADGATITTLLDQSGNGRNITGGAGNKAVMRFSVLNGKKVFDFTPNSAYYNLPSMASLTECEAFYIMKDDGTGGSYGYQLHGLGTGGGFIHVPYFSNTVYDNAFYTNRQNFYAAGTWNNWNLYSVQGKSGTNNFVFRFNNVALLTATITPTFRSTPTLGTDSAGGWYEGRIAEIIYCNVVPNSTERANLSSYFNSTYGLSLP